MLGVPRLCAAERFRASTIQIAVVSLLPSRIRLVWMGSRELSVSSVVSVLLVVLLRHGLFWGTDELSCCVMLNSSSIAAHEECRNVRRASLVEFVCIIYTRSLSLSLSYTHTHTHTKQPSHVQSQMRSFTAASLLSFCHLIPWPCLVAIPSGV